MVSGQLKSRLNMKNFTSFAPVDFLCNKWRGSNLGPVTNPNKCRQLQVIEKLWTNSLIVKIGFPFDFVQNILHQYQRFLQDEMTDLKKNKE